MINKIIKSLAAGLLCAVMAACAESSEEGTPVDVGMAPVGFSTDVTTRTTLIEDTEALKKLSAGIGVFAYFTDAETWAEATLESEESSENKKWKAPKDYPVPDFMYNQQITWGIQRIEGTDTIRGWIYSPVKYWPNSTGNNDPRYISFFAYAPYEEYQESAKKEYGVTEMPSEEDKTPRLKYKIGPVGSMSDLLYATPAIDATRNGNGLIKIGGSGNTYQKVPLKFHHALACVDVYIQRIYDEPHYSGNEPANEMQTKIFVSQLVMDIDGGDMSDEGRLNLATGEWSELKSSEDQKLTYEGTQINNAISGTTSTKLNDIKNTELYKWGNDGTGVDAREQCLFSGNDALFFIPQEELTLTPTLTYSMVTQDNGLELSDCIDDKGNKYARIVHEVQGNSLKLNLQKGKRYKLLIHIETEHVNFEVVSVTDWDFPIRFETSIDEDGGFKDEDINHTLNETDKGNGTTDE